MKRQRFWIFLAILMVVVGSTGLFMDRLHMNGFSCSNVSLPFSEGLGVNTAEARQLYKAAGESLDNHQPEDALASYTKISTSYKRLRPMILLHMAEAYEQQGNEGKLQVLLDEMAQEYANTPFELMALYERGQSAMRSRDFDKARDSFQALLKKSPGSNLTYGAQYYLGELASMNHAPEEAAGYYRKYLEVVPDGTFSAAAAKELEALPRPLEAKDYQVIGMAEYSENDWKQALLNLQKAPLEAVWLEQGKANLKLGKVKDGIQVLEHGLLLSTDQDRSEEGIKTLMNAVPQTKAMLQQLLKASPKVGTDFILWQLEKNSAGAERAGYGQQLLVRYPDSKWGPETSWQLMWPLYLSGNKAAFLTRADSHLQHFPNSLSAPKVLFWKAKIYLAQGKQEIAIPLLKQLTEKYPHQYYAFRAVQLMDGDTHPWKTDPEDPYPPGDQKSIQAEALSEYVGDKDLAPVVAELIRTESPKDIMMILNARHLDDLPAPLESVVHFQQQEYAQSIRIMRDYLDKQRKAGNTAVDPNLYKLLYPALYCDEIQRYAEKNSLDPYLVQALMRQESYFNPFAVSSSQAMGLMQLLPSTASGVAQWEQMPGFNAAALFNPEVNIRLGTRYLRYLHERFNGNSMLSVGGYNGGPGAMSRWSSASPAFTADPDQFIETLPAAQTRDYIKEVFSHYWNYQQLYRS